MQKSPLVSTFPELTKHIDKEVLALGYLKMNRSLVDTIINMLILSTVGIILKNMIRKDPVHYLLLSENAIHHVVLQGTDIKTREDFLISDMSNCTVTDSNNTLWHIAFTHKGQSHSFDVFRYFLPDDDGSYTSDTELMKRIGDMTSLFQQKLATA